MILHLFSYCLKFEHNEYNYKQYNEYIKNIVKKNIMVVLYVNIYQSPPSANISLVLQIILSGLNPPVSEFSDIGFCSVSPTRKI